MSISQSLFAAFVIGVVCGLRSMTGPAGIAWGMHRGWIAAHGSLFTWWGSTTGVALLTLAAVGELVVDKLPWTPSRLQVPSLVVRAVAGGLCGAALLSAASGSIVIGVASGAVGAIVGSFAGFHARMGTERALNLPDWAVALAEDAIAVAAACVVVAR